MNNEKLEDRKVVSTVSFVLCLILTIMFISGDIDSVKDGGKPVVLLSLISGIATIISFVIAVVTSSTLKKRQGKENECRLLCKLHIKLVKSRKIPRKLCKMTKKMEKIKYFCSYYSHFEINVI